MTSASQDRQVIQKAFLSALCERRIDVLMFLVNGIKLQGVVTTYDNFVLVLQRGTSTQVVYKHAISTIVPSVPVQFPELGDDAW